MLDYLNSNNFTTSIGKSFYIGSQITNILRDEKYIGKITYGKVMSKLRNLKSNPSSMKVSVQDTSSVIIMNRL